MKNKRINSFLKLIKEKLSVKMKTTQYSCSSHKWNGNLWKLLNQFIHLNKMEDEYFADNMIIYIEKISWKI